MVFVPSQQKTLCRPKKKFRAVQSFSCGWGWPCYSLCMETNLTTTAHTMQSNSDRFFANNGEAIARMLQGETISYYRQTRGSSSVLPDKNAVRRFRIVRVNAVGVSTHGRWFNALVQDLQDGDKESVKSLRMDGIA